MQYKNDKILVAIYCRLSEEDRDKLHETDDSRSIQNQKSMLISFAQANNWEIYKIYSDDDYAGSDRNRPAFNELMRDAEARKFQIVLCKSQSRFTREMELVENILHYKFVLWGIRFIGLADNADTDNEGNKKSRQINGLVNEWYLEDLSHNIKSVLTDRRKKGIFIGAFAPHGYMKDPNIKGHLIPDPEAAEVIHLIFELFASGMGKNAIAKYLNVQGIPNPTEYKRRKGLRHKVHGTERSTLWQYYVVADILINEVYIGNLVQGRYGSVSYKTKQSKPRPKSEWIRANNTHEPIIERELWDKVQRMIAAKTKPGWTGEVKMFARKTRCMYCGYTMASGRDRDGRGTLRCKTRALKEGACQGSFVGEKELEETVLKELHQIINQYLDMDEAEQQLVIVDRRQQRIKSICQEIAEGQSAIENANMSIRMLYEDRVQGIISPADFVSLSDSFRKTIEEHQSKIEYLQGVLDGIEQENVAAVSKRELLERCRDITSLNYDIVNTLIDYIEIGKRPGDHRLGYKVPVVIHWNF